MKTEDLSLLEAMELLKKGVYVRRNYWNKTVYLFMKNGLLMLHADENTYYENLRPDFEDYVSGFNDWQVYHDEEYRAKLIEIEAVEKELGGITKYAEDLSKKLDTLRESLC